MSFKLQHCTSIHRELLIGHKSDESPHQHSLGPVLFCSARRFAILGNRRRTMCGLQQSRDQIWLPDGEQSFTMAQPMGRGPEGIFTVMGIRMDSRSLTYRQDAHITSQYSIHNILRQICPRRDVGNGNELVVSVENAREHVSRRGRQNVNDRNLRTATHPPDAANLRPGPLFLFDHRKKGLQGVHLHRAEERLDAMVRTVTDISSATWIATCHEYTTPLPARIDRMRQSVEYASCRLEHPVHTNIETSPNR
jgi:hypothetical protein